MQKVIIECFSLHFCREEHWTLFSCRWRSKDARGSAASSQASLPVTFSVQLFTWFWQIRPNTRNSKTIAKHCELYHREGVCGGKRRRRDRPPGSAWSRPFVPRPAWALCPKAGVLTHSSPGLRTSERGRQEYASWGYSKKLSPRENSHADLVLRVYEFSQQQSKDHHAMFGRHLWLSTCLAPG